MGKSLADRISQRTQSGIANSQVIANLQKENLDLQSQLANQKSFQFKITSVCPSIQVRQTFLLSEIKERARSLKEEGQGKPVVLIPTQDSEYEAAIEDGELTWRAAKLLVSQGLSKWEMLQGVWSSLSKEEDAYTKSLVHHRHKVNLNPLDETEGIVKAISKTIPWSEEEKQEDFSLLLKPIISSIAASYERDSTFAELYKSLLTKTVIEGQEILNSIEDIDDRKKTTILQLCRWLVHNPKAFQTNKLPLIFLNSKLKEAVRHPEYPISCNHAIALSRVKDEQKQIDLIEQCQANSWSLKELRNAIKATKEPEKKISKTESYTKQKNQVTKGIKILSTYSGSMPGPLSLTMMTGRASLLR